ncbi:MAG: SGNH/GDSL hydrolase family protein [Rhizobacter sp.]
MPLPRTLTRALALLGLALALHLSLTPVTALASPLALAVVGDSDSHGYHDTRAFPPGTPERGGAQRPTTYQWTEVLAALRSPALDLGPRTDTGTFGRLARALRAVGLDARAPRKRDHLHNFAVSGQGCEDLWGGVSQQVPQLLNLMDEQPARWRGGVVVIRIGVNTFGRAADLERLSRNPRDPEVAGRIDACVGQVRAAAEAIARAHPQARVVLVGIFDNAHWGPYHARWRDPAALANISAGLDRFDQALQRLAAERPQFAFFDDRAWFASLWGGRNAEGAPAYRSVPFGPLQVINASGDAPRFATLADGHAGTAWNALWARALVDLLNRRFQAGIPPLTDAELASLLGRPFAR